MARVKIRDFFSVDESIDSLFLNMLNAFEVKSITFVVITKNTNLRKIYNA